MINLLFALIGVSAGALVSGGICSLLTTIGIVNRLAFKTKTVSKIKLYENTILFSAIISTFIYLIEPRINLAGIQSDILMAFYGIFTGIFVGCLGLSLAEALDASAILFRRVKLKRGFKYVICCAALGKFVGNIIYFIK